MAEDLRSFVGRAAELAELRETMADVRSGRPQAVLVSGPPGIGKTSLIDQFLLGLDHAKVLRASGEQWEALVAFGVIDQLLRTAGISKGLLLASRNRSLSPEEPVVVGAVFLEAIEALEHEAPRRARDRRRAVGGRRLAPGGAVRPAPCQFEPGADTAGGTRRGHDQTARWPAAIGQRDDRSIAALSTHWKRGDPTARDSVRRGRVHGADRATAARSHGRKSVVCARLVVGAAEGRWRTWQPCSPRRVPSSAGREPPVGVQSPARALVEACSVLGVRSSLRSAAALAGLDEPGGRAEEAVAVELLQGIDRVQIWDVTFPHPLVQAAVYEHVSPTGRIRLHRTRPSWSTTPGPLLRHRVAAATPPDDELAATLDDFARVEMRWGAWASAASALVEASRMSVDRASREQRLLRAIDAIVSAGDLPQASASRRTSPVRAGALRDAALGHLAVLRGRSRGRAAADAGLGTGQRGDDRTSARCWRCGGRSIRSGGCAARTSSSGAAGRWISSRTTKPSVWRPKPSAGWGSASAVRSPDGISAYEAC